MKVHHVGYLVADIDAAISEFVALGYEVRKEKLYDPARKIYLCFMENNGVMIELVSPSEDCRLFTSLQRRIGNAPYHICYFTEGGGHIRRNDREVTARRILYDPASRASSGIRRTTCSVHDESRDRIARDIRDITSVKEY